MNTTLWPDSDMNRQPAVAGQFYPVSAKRLEADLHDYFADNQLNKSKNNPVAVISPHAGYVFSGRVAAAAFAQINAPEQYKNIILIGTSHYHSYQGASVYFPGNYTTPLGEVNTNQAIATSLQKNPLFAFDPAFHQKEHCIEVQLPFLQYIFKDKISVVPVLLGTNDPLICRKLAQILKPYFHPENLFVISTDFSHYPSSEDALNIDNQVADSIVTNNPDQFIQIISSFGYNKISGLATACCSWGSVLTLLYLTENDNDIGFRKVLYRNSGDSGYGDTKQVVGYYALVAEKSSNRVFELSENEKTKLLEIARNAIKFHLAGNTVLDDEGENLPDVLRENCGAFVTLKVEGRLRGCIGTFESLKPLHKTIAEMATASASRDYRFNPLSETELAELNISISVLSTLQKITDISLIRLGVDGIYIRKGNRSGTFLPEVATETGWNLNELLSHCARDKAGIGWEGWKDEQTELFIYQSVNFSG